MLTLLYAVIKGRLSQHRNNGRNIFLRHCNPSKSRIFAFHIHETRYNVRKVVANSPFTRMLRLWGCLCPVVARLDDRFDTLRLNLPGRHGNCERNTKDPWRDKNFLFAVAYTSCIEGEQKSRLLRPQAVRTSHLRFAYSPNAQRL